MSMRACASIHFSDKEGSAQCDGGAAIRCNSIPTICSPPPFRHYPPSSLRPEMLTRWDNTAFGLWQLMILICSDARDNKRSHKGEEEGPRARPRRCRQLAKRGVGGGTACPCALLPFRAAAPPGLPPEGAAHQAVWFKPVSNRRIVILRRGIEVCTVGAVGKDRVCLVLSLLPLFQAVE